MSDLNVAIVAFDQMSPFHLSVPCTVLNKDRRVQGFPWFETRVCSVESGQLSTTAGFSFQCADDLSIFDWADIIIVPSWRDVNEIPPASLLKALSQAYKDGKRIIGLCLGTYVLAAAGLLKGKKATTHWAWFEDFHQRYPDITLTAAALYVEDDRIMTSAGVAAGIDCCLHLVREICGYDVANHVAKQLVVSPHREGFQTQFIEQSIQKTVSDQRLTELLEWIKLHLQQKHSVDEIANKLALSRRTFTRHFKKITGTTFQDWLLHERIVLAQKYLETTKHSIDHVAMQCGFNTGTLLRKHFTLQLGISPSSYRRSFQKN